MKRIFSLERIFFLQDSQTQIRIKMFNKVVFRFSFKPTLNTI